MNVLVIPYNYPNIYCENASIFIQDQVQALTKNGLNVYVFGAIPVSFKNIIKKKFLKFGNFQYKDNENIKIFLFPAIPKLKFFNEFIRIKINKYLINKYYKNNKVDIIHVHNSIAGEVAIWAKQKYDIPYVITEHSSIYARNLISNNDIKKYEDIYKNASYRIAVSKEFCKILNKTFNTEFNYIPNVVDTDYFKPLEKRVINDTFQFINIASLDENKNQLLLLKAFAKAFNENKNIKLVIMGEGTERNNLENEIVQLHIQDQVKLFGFAKREEILKELQKSDIFILSSKYETFGVVIIEAMSTGLPVISTRCGGPESIIENDKLGILVENNNLEALSKAMKNMYKNKNEYCNKNIRKYVIQEFSEKIFSQKLINIYKNIKMKGDL